MFKHTVVADRQGLTVFMLGRRCANDFSEILLLASNGYGFAALQILRSMFEKLIDARYLHEHPKEVDNFWDYHLVLLVKLGYQDVALKFDAEWENKVARFVAVQQGLLFLILILQLEVRHYGWGIPRPKSRNF